MKWILKIGSLRDDRPYFQISISPFSCRYDPAFKIPLHFAYPENSSILFVFLGPPDVTQPCETSLQAWSPEFNLFNVSMATPCLKPLGCILELYFLYPVYSDSLLIWTTNFSTNSKALSDLEILTEQGDSVHLGPMDTFCDIPLTVKLNLTKKVSGIKIYTFDEKMEIDAAQLISTPHSLLCSNCKPVRYRILRDPPFQDGSPAMVMQPGRMFTDK